MPGRLDQRGQSRFWQSFDTKKVENGLLFTPTNLNKGMDVADLTPVAHTEAYEPSYRQRTK
jgi:hypothetical protein